MSKQSNGNGKPRTTLTFLPAIDVDMMLRRAWTNENGEVLFAQKTRIINEMLREGLTKRGFARKRDLLAA